MSNTIKNRLHKLRSRLEEQEIDAILVSQPENRRYLSDFQGSAGLLLITQQQAFLATDFRYIEQAQQQAPVFDVVPVTSDLAAWFPQLVATAGTARLGFEAEHISFTQHRKYADLLKEGHSSTRLAPVSGLVESLRAVKEAEEIDLITQAAQIADRALESIGPRLQPGATEKEVAWELEKSIRNLGSESIPFDIIVASGPNAALPHARPTERVINRGEPIVIDIGARCGGYCSDISRTICLGTPDDTFNRVYDAVLGAQLAAIAIINQGMSGDEADSVARAVIAESGYGEAFGHALGHGVGLAPHELPRLGPGSTDRLVDGMVFTIEPGIYLRGWGGVRIEDTVIIENGKIEVISQARKVYSDN